MIIEAGNAARVSAFLSPVKILFGFGATKEVGREASRLGAHSALVVTRAGRARVGWVDDIAALLTLEGIAVDVFDEVEIDSPAWVIDECAARARSVGVDLVVGLGGGSTLDTAKGVAIMTANSGGILDYVGAELVPRKGCRLILLPTTWSGSEVSAGLGVVDEAINEQRVVDSAFALPDVAIVDPTYAMALPPRMAADTGMDALVHAIEPCVSVAATPFSDMLALQAIRLIANSLPAVVSRPDDRVARSDMGLAAVLAALAFNSAGLGPIHDLASEVTMRRGIGHARACAVLAAPVMEHEKTRSASRLGLVASALGEEVAGLTDDAASDLAVSAVSRLVRRLGIPAELGEYGIEWGSLVKRLQ